MPAFGTRSRMNLEGVDPRLVRLFEEVVKGFDCTVLSGVRTAKEQADLYASGRTKPGPILTQKDGVHKRSNHQGGKAVDVAPWPIDWKDSKRFYHFAGYVRGVAGQMGIDARWGGDWDSDTELHDQSFYDLPHFEVV